MTFLATIVTGGEALKEFQLLLYTLEQWVPTADVFVFTDTPTLRLLDALKSRIRIEKHAALDDYVGLTRKDMEARSGRRYISLWHDFMMEKASVIQWVFETRPKAAEEGVWFLDADVCLLAPLPPIPVDVTLALSPHFIRKADEARFGTYNGGMLWMRDKRYLDIWRKAVYGSRFYEQAALEDLAVAAGSEFHEIPIQNNFGWWRYLQSADAPPVIESRLGYNRRIPGCGLMYEDAVLRSVHTHWEEANEFNVWMRGRLEFLGRSHPPAKILVQHLNRLFWKKEKKE